MVLNFWDLEGVFGVEAWWIIDGLPSTSQLVLIVCNDVSFQSSCFCFSHE